LKNDSWCRKMWDDWFGSLILPTSVFFTGEISLEGEFFLPLVYFGEIWTQKKHSCRQKFIHMNPFSSTFKAFIQHLDELASGYVLVVPPGRKTKNHRKNTAPYHTDFGQWSTIQILDNEVPYRFWTMKYQGSKKITPLGLFTQGVKVVL
jgi:curved DNA-binding protein CbpA